MVNIEEEEEEEEIDASPELLHSHIEWFGFPYTPLPTYSDCFEVLHNSYTPYCRNDNIALRSQLECFC